MTSKNESLDGALGRIRHYAVEHGMTPNQVLDCFLVGTQASHIFGGGKMVESTGWQSAPAAALANEAV